MRRLLLTVLVLNFFLIAPLWWRYGEISSYWLAWETLIIAPLMLLLPRGLLRRWFAAVVIGWVVLATLANVGTAATHMAFARPLNLYLDIPLLRSIYHLLEGNVGQLIAVFAIIALVIILLATIAGMLCLLLPSVSYSVKRLSGVVALAMLLVATTLAAFELNGVRVVDNARLPIVNTTRFQWQQITGTHAARLAFSEQLATSPIEAQPLPGLEGRNVLLNPTVSQHWTSRAMRMYCFPPLPTYSSASRSVISMWSQAC